MSLTSTASFYWRCYSYDDFQDLLVRLVFCHPTQARLVPCRHYVEGRCTRTDNCRWSHGEVRRLGDLTAWRESEDDPGPGSQVLAKTSSGLWRRGTVTETLMGDFLVQLDVGGADPELKTEDEIFVLEAEDCPAPATSQEADQAQPPELETFVPTELAAGLVFGSWERSTRGVGSRLMMAMGWRAGSGLGRRGEGRVEPVTARLYPQGKSLDWCMEMREKYGDSGVTGDVEKILKKEAKEAARKSKQVVEAEKRRDDSAKSLFDFINIQLGDPSKGKNEHKHQALRKSKDNSNSAKIFIKDESDADMKLRKFKMSEQVCRLEKEVSKLTESYSRLAGRDPTSAASVKSKLEAKKRELESLKYSEKKLIKEEGSRKSKSKLTIF